MEVATVKKDTTTRRNTQGDNYNAKLDSESQRAGEAARLQFCYGKFGLFTLRVANPAVFQEVLRALELAGQWDRMVGWLSEMPSPLPEKTSARLTDVHLTPRKEYLETSTDFLSRCPNHGRQSDCGSAEGTLADD